MNDAIHAEDLHVRYRAKNGSSVEAVRGLSFSVKPGEVVGFLGPNGAGKSSTLKALMGFVEPTGGTCTLFGEKAGSIDSKKRIGYLPEVALYYPFLTPRETLTLYGELQGLKGKSLRNEVEQLLELVGLKQAMNKQNRSMSKGMLQRVGIAQSLLGSPELLILDEMTSGLDPVGRKELRHLLKDRQHQGCTLFFSSHELSEVEMLCDRILLIHKGVLVEERQIGQLKQELRKYSVVFKPGRATDSDLDGQCREVQPGLFEAHFDSKESLIKALGALHNRGGDIVDVVAQEGSLEDYFVETIGRAA